VARKVSPAGALIMDYYRVPHTAGSAALKIRAPLPPPPPDLEPPSIIELSLSLQTMAAELSAEREWRDRLGSGITVIEVPAIGAFTPAQVPYIQGTWGPNDGYVWAVQRLTVGQLLASDTMQLYRGTSVADANGNQNLLQGFAGSAGAVQAWTPGRTGCVIDGNQSIIVTGTLNGGPYTLNADVIQVETWLVPYFLL
jgi:hypothetical protein